jgi:hypothetical protein
MPLSQPEHIVAFLILERPHSRHVSIVRQMGEKSRRRRAGVFSSWRSIGGACEEG